MKKSIYALIFIILLFFLSLFIWNKARITMSLEPTLIFKILSNQNIDKDIQINIRKINEMNDVNSNKNQIFTILKDGVYYPQNNKYDFEMYEIFIKKNNQFAYISGENINFSEDESSIRGKSGRRGEISIDPIAKDDHIFLHYIQYYNNKKIENLKKLKLLESYQFSSHIFNEKTKLEYFVSVNLPQ